MSIALTVKHMLACGASHEAVVSAVEEIEARMGEPLSGAERTRLWRERKCVTPVTLTSPNVTERHTPPMIYNSTPCDLAKAKSIKTPLSDSLFEGFWAFYPRKVGKGSARKAYRKATTRATEDEIVAGVKRYALAAQFMEPQFIKHGATWLNADCWLDEPDKPKGGQVVPMSGRLRVFARDPPKLNLTEEQKAELAAKLSRFKQRP